MKKILLIAVLVSLAHWLSAQITTNTPFKINSNNPVDTRMQIATLGDTTTITFKWEGLLVHVNDDDTYYKWNGSNWEEFTTGGGLSNGDKGDITVGSSGASLTINDDAITAAKIGTGEVGADALDAAAVEAEYNNQVSVVDSATAAAGASTTVYRWTPERVAQAIAAQASSTATAATANYTAFRAYTGGATTMIVTDSLTEGVFVKTNSGKSDNGGLVIVDGNAVAWERVRKPEEVWVNWFGATGDGATDATTAIRTAMLASDEGTEIHFPPGTYIVNNSIDDPGNNAAQSFIGHGMPTIKRADEVVSTTTAAVANSATTITVSDASGFAVGDEITLLDVTGTYGGLAENESMQPSLEITDITSNTITVASGVTLPPSGNLTGGGEWPIGTKVLRVFPLLNVEDGKRTIVRGIRFDGNAEGNPSHRGWTHNHSILTLGSGSIVDGCEFVDTPGENMFIRDHVRVVNNYADSLYGSFVHLTNGDTTGMYVVLNGNNVNNFCLATNAVNQHGEAGVTFSANVKRVVISNNIFSKSPEAFVGDLTSANDADIVITGNIAEDCEGGAVLIESNSDTRSDNITIANNQFIRSSAIYAFAGGLGQIEDGAGWDKLNISDNLLEDTRIFIAHASNVSIHDNTVHLTRLYADSIGITSGAAVTIGKAGGHISIKDNTIYQDTFIVDAGINYQTTDNPLQIKDSGGSNTGFAYAVFSIEGNYIENFDYGITNGSVTAYNRVAEVYVGSSIRGNTIVNRDQTSTQSVGIWGWPGFEISNNFLYGPYDAADDDGDDDRIGIVAKGVQNTIRTTQEGEWIHHNTIQGFSESIQIGKTAPLDSNRGYNITCEYNRYTGLIDNNSPTDFPSIVEMNRVIKYDPDWPRPWVRVNTSNY